MELPTDVISIIHEFSKPLTRNDWRLLHKMTEDDFVRLLFLATIKINRSPLLKYTFHKASDIMNSKYYMTRRDCQHLYLCTCSVSFCSTNMLR